MSSSRVLTQKHLNNLIQTAAGNPPAPPKLEPNQVQLYSYYKPGLVAGTYSILAKQVIVAEPTAEQGRQTLEVYNRKVADKDGAVVPQEFTVVTPQFSLDPKLVNSFYPPEGHQDEGRVLPHVVLSDAHFPWERYAGNEFARPLDPDLNRYAEEGGETVDKNGKVTDDDDEMVFRSMVPWVSVALILAMARVVAHWLAAIAGMDDEL
jgi:hypothetical protein